MVTIQDIANKVGISNSEVSRVLNGRERAGRRVSEKTREMILNTAKEMGYEPNVLARSLVTKRTNILGALIYSVEYPFFATIMSKLEASAHDAGYQLLTVTRDMVGPGFSEEEIRKAERDHLRLMARYRVDGVLFYNWAPLKHANRPVYPSSLKSTPVIALGYVEESAEVDAVSLDLPAGAAQAVHHLFQLGHRSIGYVGTDTIGPLAPYSRARGYLDAIQHYGLSAVTYSCEDGGFDDGYKFGKYFVSLENRPTAVLVYQDVFGMGFYRALSEEGLRIPADVSMVGFDGIKVVQYLPVRFTTVQTPFREMCAEAVGLVVRRIEQKQKEKQNDEQQHVVMSQRIMIRPELSVGESTAPPTA